ncbi:hypothetical protein M431DRAFT_499139 [Trichoderma harzianum CBS 226.95]|uniref:Uncharacterized protein n=1 Tax=Trichoderma harzianum CBS 226.95 TaxID=983964 RepID=A0A2T3ZZR8_TRIHA|nr:hypothetical protein M431DRAFT_499139 [Trichoderma harzianum CBS 226.95]PTB50305.1 hypothetical protein M431DRAFT_499139 [Trichoderma harzianum CBS 226.95]
MATQAPNAAYLLAIYAANTARPHPKRPFPLGFLLPRYNPQTYGFRHQVTTRRLSHAICASNPSYPPALATKVLCGL